MGKQKIVLKVQMEGAKKRAKALKLAVGLEGVISAAADGENIVVVGDGIDSVELTVLLRRKMGYAELLSVGAAEEKKDEKKDKPAEGDKKSVQPMILTYPYQYAMSPQPYTYETRDPYNSDPCSIM